MGPVGRLFLQSFEKRRDRTLSAHSRTRLRVCPQCFYQNNRGRPIHRGSSLTREDAGWRWAIISSIWLGEVWWHHKDPSNFDLWLQIVICEEIWGREHILRGHSQIHFLNSLQLEHPTLVLKHGNYLIIGKIRKQKQTRSHCWDSCCRQIVLKQHCRSRGLGGWTIHFTSSNSWCHWETAGDR
jgi:hypothetical protein